jgi:hypothetical protein
MPARWRPCHVSQLLLLEAHSPALAGRPSHPPGDTWRHISVKPTMSAKRMVTSGCQRARCSRSCSAAPGALPSCSCCAGSAAASAMYSITWRGKMLSRRLQVGRGSRQAGMMGQSVGPVDRTGQLIEPASKNENTLQQAAAGCRRVQEAAGGWGSQA